MIDEVAKHGHVLTPGRYVGAEDATDDGEGFAVKYPRMVAELAVAVRSLAARFCRADDGDVPGRKNRVQRLPLLAEHVVGQVSDGDRCL